MKQEDTALILIISTLILLSILGHLSRRLWVVKRKESSVHQGTGMKAASLDIRRISFPVVGTDPQTGEAIRPLVFGTAFCVGEGVFLTAGHVIRNIQNLGAAVTLLDLTDDRGAMPCAVSDIEVLDGCDLGVLACDIGGIAILEWQESNLPLLTDVSAIGYPFAVTLHEQLRQWHVTPRGFKGSVMTRTRLWSLRDAHAGYEVSSPFPTGLSGAPLTVHAGPIPLLRLVGIVLGRERVEIEGEITEFGKAVDIMSVADVQSRILGGTLRQRRDREVAAIRGERQRQHANGV